MAGVVKKRGGKKKKVRASLLWLRLSQNQGNTTSYVSPKFVEPMPWELRNYHAHVNLNPMAHQENQDQCLKPISNL